MACSPSPEQAGMLLFPAASSCCCLCGAASALRAGFALLPRRRAEMASLLSCALLALHSPGHSSVTLQCRHIQALAEAESKCASRLAFSAHPWSRHVSPVGLRRDALPQRLHGCHGLAHGAQRSLQLRAALAW